MKRRGENKKELEGVGVSDVESEEDVQSEQKPKQKNSEKKIKKSTIERDEKEENKGLNWSAIVIMLLFAIPMVITGAMQLMDFMYPEAAKARLFRQRVLHCYEAANPSKTSEVDYFIEKYIGREHVLLAKLRTKYEKVPECQF